MKRVKCLEESFKRNEFGIDEEEELMKEINSSQKMISFSMEIDKGMAYRIYDFFEEHEIKRNDGGNFIVSLSYPEDEWVYGMILSFGKHAKIISPESLKKEIANRFKQAYENYF